MKTPVHTFKDRRKAFVRVMTVFALAIAVTVGVVFTATLAEPRTAADDQKLIEQFRAWLQTAEAPAELKARALEAIEAVAAEPDARSMAVTEALRELSPEFRDALQALVDEDLSTATTGLSKLESSENPHLAADAAFFHARALFMQERYEDAAVLLDKVLKTDTAAALHRGEAQFLKAIAESQTLDYTKAIASLEAFVKDNPTAPERLLFGAQRQIEQLRLVEEGKLSDVQMRMDFSRRRLGLFDSGEGTRNEQKKIVTMLEKLIKEAEDQESQGKGSGKGKGKGRQKSEGEGEGEGEGQGDKGKGSKGGESGGGSQQIDENTVQKMLRKGPQSPWSKLRDKERDPVFSAIKEKFPGRYEKLIEQYYQSFQDEQE